jgi:hypothetical protein
MRRLTRRDARLVDRVRLTSIESSAKAGRIAAGSVESLLPGATVVT